MESAATKRPRAVVRGSASDRLSGLPDELLCRVLSFLPSRQAVQTTVLSKRWMDLWRSVPAIRIATSDFGGGWFERHDSWRKMQDFTTNLLMLNSAKRLDAFRLDCSYQAGLLDSLRDVERWIRFGIKCQPIVLQIRVDLKYHFQIPRLGSEFHRLKRVEFNNLSLDACFSERLCSGCPALESLVLGYCDNEFVGIQSNTLKSLRIYTCRSRVADRLVVRAPCLASISLGFPFYYYRNGLLLEAGSSLVTASISVTSEEFSPRTEAILLGSLFNVTRLELKSFQAMAILDNEYDKFPAFDNLRSLSLKHCFCSERDADKFKALGRFLRKSPNLEELILQDFWYSGGTARTCRTSAEPELKTVKPIVGPIEFPMLENLRTLFLDKCDLRDNFRIFRHLLRRSSNLEKLTVQHCELPEVSMGQKGKGKLNGFQNLVNFQCEKLVSTEIIYKKGVEIQELVSFLLDISGSATKNSITLTKV